AKQLMTLNVAFHSRVARSSRNQILAGILEDLAKQVQWHFSAVAPERGEGSWKEHEGIYAAIEAGDADLAGRLAIQHGQRTQEAFFMQFLSGTPHSAARGEATRA
ncbi:MAG: FCD domain-containing protein, partial [Actinomycetota bacterium]